MSAVASLARLTCTVSNNSITGLRLWNVTANCGANTPITQEYVTMVDASGNASLLGRFDKYGFLDASVCEVTSLLTTVCTNYSNDLISSEVISSTQQMFSYCRSSLELPSFSRSGAYE
ncbi:hypothetical protein BDR04DRAFT_480200 [Suillus decipiens]|nr:hypothetical protein BDR04DRAFT_480200 [Suillus decipiens]